MSALDDAAQAVEEARGALIRRLYPWTVDPGQADEIADALIAAVRHHDAEIVRAMGPETMVGQYARDTIAQQLDSAPGVDTLPEVEIRYAGGPTIRIAGYSVTADAETGLVVVEGFIASRTGQPHRGDAVRIAYLGIPGRGALADITASVEVFTRLEVLNIRIRTTVRPEDNR